MTNEDRTADHPPGAVLHQMIWGYMVSQAVHVTAKLGIVDVLGDGPKTSSEIAEAAGGAQHLWLEQLPGYAPEPNPVEGIWHYLNWVRLGTSAAAR